METSRVPSSLNRLSVPLSRGQLRTRQEAKEQEAVIHEKLRKINQPIPPYEWQNYIGKGTYGRVYVAKDLNPNGRGRVAVKVLDVDAVDFKVNLQDRNQSFDDFLKELKTLQRLQSYGARNVNQVFEVLEVHSQLWIISEYCPGGSVHTLMQATNNKVEEKYLIPIARELAIGLNAVHQACIIHRDVKAANVMIHEEGALQIIDFGVAGMLHEKEDKRMTVVGTPHWMGPEALNPGREGYGIEVDIWAFGCTLIEMATGAPPRSRLGPGQLDREFRIRGAPKLRADQGHSAGLCELVEFILKLDPKQRPSMEQILDHPYLRGTDIVYPTRSLRGFVRDFENWATAGGQRHSLFNNFGAEAAKKTDDIISKPEWRFSTLESTELMEDLPATIDEQLSSDFINTDHPYSSHLNQVTDMASTQAQEDAFNSYDASEPLSPYLSEAELTPGGSPKAHEALTLPTESTRAPTMTNDNVLRGEKQLGRLFDPRKSHYAYAGLNIQTSDLPLRNSTPDSSATDSKGKEIDANVLGTSNSGNIALADPATLKAKRKDRPPTMAWEFPTGAPEDVPDDDSAKQRPTTMGWQFPVAESEEGHEKGHGHKTSATSSQSSGLGFFNDDYIYGGPSEEAYEDPYSVHSGTPQTASYTPNPESSRGMSPDFVNRQSTRQTLDLDSLMGEGSDDRVKARQTLDLDALMSDMDLSAAGSPTYAAPTVEDDAEDEDAARGSTTRASAYAAPSVEDDFAPEASTMRPSAHAASTAEDNHRNPTEGISNVGNNAQSATSNQARATFRSQVRDYTDFANEQVDNFNAGRPPNEKFENPPPRPEPVILNRKYCWDLLPAERQAKIRRAPERPDWPGPELMKDDADPNAVAAYITRQMQDFCQWMGWWGDYMTQVLEMMDEEEAEEARKAATGGSTS